MSADDLKSWMESKGYSPEQVAVLLGTSVGPVRCFLAGKSINPNNYRRLVQIIRADSKPKKAAVG